MKENSIEEDMKIVEQIKDIFLYLKFHGWINDIKQDIDTDKAIRTLKHILSDYKRVLKENEELNKNYNSLIDKIILKINEYDYKFKKAKKQNKNDIADYYWDLIINFKKLLGGE